MPNKLIDVSLMQSVPILLTGNSRLIAPILVGPLFIVSLFLRCAHNYGIPTSPDTHLAPAAELHKKVLALI